MEVATELIKRLFQPKTYSLSEVSSHCHPNDCWIVIGDHVYDVTSFLEKHPGGKDVLLEHAGRDATVAFYGAGHFDISMAQLESLRIGTLTQKERLCTDWLTPDRIKVLE